MTINNKKDKRHSKLFATIETESLSQEKQFLAKLREDSAKEFQCHFKKQISLWRIIMNNRIAKLTTAAVITIIAVLSVTVFINNSATPAYAIEQTIEASHSVEYLFIKIFKPSDPDKPAKCWIQFDQAGQVKNIRIEQPGWMSPEGDDVVAVWKNNKIECLLKQKNTLVTLKDKEVAAKMLSMVQQLDPKNAISNIKKAQEDGTAEVKIETPENRSKPIVITSTPLVETDLPFQRLVFYIDQTTKLVNNVETYQLKDGQYILSSTLELYDYNIPIAPDMFTLNNVPDNVMRMDQTTQQVGLEQGDLSDNEIAVEIIRQFLQALIEEDYAKAGKLFGGVPAERIAKTYSQIKFLKIISIGEPTPKPEMNCLYVPCTIEIEENGKVTQWHPEHSYVRQVHGQPDRWEIIGGFKGI